MSSEMLLLLSGPETSLTSIGDSFRSGSLSEEKGFSKASLLIRSGQDSRSGKVGAGEVDPSSSKAKQKRGDILVFLSLSISSYRV